MNDAKRKQSLYFPEEMLHEIQEEAYRQDRSLSWVVQQAWRLSRMEINRMPSISEVLSSSSAEPTLLPLEPDPEPEVPTSPEVRTFARGRFDKDP